MSLWLVTRHPGAQRWLAQQGLSAHQVVPHLEPAQLAPGDDVVGVLPYHLAAIVIAGGGHFYNLDVTIPPCLRGQELTAEQLSNLGAKITEYRVEQGSRLIG